MMAGAGAQELPAAARERPIIFGTAMVQLILAGRKTQTRRLITGPMAAVVERRMAGVPFEEIRCPYGQPGDRLWVRESWWHHESAFINQAGFLGGTIVRIGDAGGSYNANEEFSPARHPEIWKKRNARYMPRWASRLLLEVTEVRVQRLQEISDDDARAEGFEPVRSFARVWDDVNGERAPWATNPWVWAISFRGLP